ncbi:MAG: tail fiber protein [Methylobacter sp.]|jgi:microcystin-dependent protein|nr:tail fiber protein [Methylobacter sp.]
MDAFMGTIMAVGFNFAPRGWAFCNGQLLPISQNSAMFALLGTMYGGDGQSTFGLPDLRGRVVVGSQDYGPGLAPVQQGEKAGTNNVTIIGNGAVSISLTSANLPPHTHPASMSLNGLSATTDISIDTTAHAAPPATTAFTAGSTLTSSSAGGPTSAAIYLPPTTAQATPASLGGVTTTVTGTGAVTVGANTGGGQALAAPVQTQALASIMQPYLGLNYIICLQGIFPSRN